MIALSFIDQKFRLNLFPVTFGPMRIFNAVILLSMDLAYTCVKHLRRLYVCQGLAPLV